jgi:hypothetical protein
MEPFLFAHHSTAEPQRLSPALIKVDLISNFQNLLFHL